MTRTVAVPGLVTVVAMAIGGALLGIIGALVAIPIAAAVRLPSTRSLDQAWRKADGRYGQ
jgi:predicted PurR-regulated permease PerM